MRNALALLLLIVMLPSVCLAAPWLLIEDSYTVSKGDTLKSIAEQYIKKNTYGPRALDEFIEGIMELNDKTDENVHEGEKLRINYWIKNNEDK